MTAGIPSAISIEGPLWGQSAATEPVLRSLGPWFGIEAATREYVRQTDRRPTWLARAPSGDVIGFLTIATHYVHAWEILVMGVVPDWHRGGVGRALVEAVERFAEERGVAFLQVKTLAPDRDDASYAKTRAFYRSLGFLEVEVFKTLWDPANPAMLFAKALRRAGETVVREGRLADAAAIDVVHREAFDGSAEARLVAELVANGLDRLSLVAESGGGAGPEVVGHVLFSELRLVERDRDEPGLALAPVGVRPPHQRRGVGASLVRAGLFAARERGHHRVLVLGDPDYYARFGFSADLARQLISPYSGPAFQAIALADGAFDGLLEATVRYPAAFDGV